ncbi:hypothetical protein ACE193_02690 [Bernardetia sp. OM2101]|uniref:hypothetical protein n=1 Tax=Bernardetia sp. OM2101 TaxID=3344876 RepID=UPI0035D0CDBA
MEFSYKEIKESYLEIKSFLKLSKKENEKLNLKTKIGEDLDFWGDDNLLLLEEYIKKYNLNFDNFNYAHHFESELEIIDIRRFIIGLIYLPFLILILSFNYLFPKNSIEPSILFLKGDVKADLTFGDLVASKLKGEFCLKADANIQLKK